MADMGKAFPTTNGVWSATTQYERLCIVTYNGSSYISTNNTINDVPDASSNWQLIAAKGVGEKGDPAPLNYLDGLAQPVNLFAVEISGWKEKDDGTATIAANNYATTSFSRNSQNKFDMIIHQFGGAPADNFRFFFFKSGGNTAFQVVSKNIGNNGRRFDLDELAPSECTRVIVETSNYGLGLIAAYYRYLDCNYYVMPNIRGEWQTVYKFDGNNLPNDQYGGVRYRVLGQVVTIEFYVDHIATGNAFNIPPEYAPGVPIWGTYSRGVNVNYSLGTDGSFNIDGPADPNVPYPSNCYLDGVITYLVG